LLVAMVFPTKRLVTGESASSRKFSNNLARLWAH
jgi:hypothetical protein